MGMENLKQLYERNGNFKRYVDKVCNTYKIGTASALQVAIVRESAKYYEEES